MNKVLNHIRVSIAVCLEILKSFFITCLVVGGIFVSIFSIVHNIIRIVEIYVEDTSGYKNFVNVDTNRMNVYTEGEGDKIAVILSAFGSPSPIFQYKTYMDRLVRENYKVVIIEYFGYGYSLSTKTERSVENITKEINTVLNNVNIGGPYTIIATGISSLYAEAYSQKYPDLVNRLVLIDGIYASTIKENFMIRYLSEYKSNINFTAFAEATGYARILSYVNPKAFGIDKMQEYGYSSQDISIYRRMIANKFYTSTMRREYDKLQDNMETMEDYVFPEYLRVTQILSTEYLKEFQEYNNEKLLKKDLNGYATDLITNPEIQKIVSIDGEKEILNLTRPDEVVEAILNY